MGTGMPVIGGGGQGPVIGPPAVTGPVVYPFAPGHPWFSAKLPSGKSLATGMRLDPGRFPDRDWDPDFRSWLALIQFTATDWQTGIRIDDPPGFDETNREINDLLGLAAQRADALNEILAQHNDFPQYFLGLLMVSRESHPATYLATRMALRIAEMVMVHFKAKFNRQRPAQVCPALFPPVEPQGHASYPSGHALQAHLLAYAAGAIYAPARDALLALADRIAFNREIAGFHYHSDTVAGVKVAKQAFERLEPLPAFVETVSRARYEWT